MPMRRRRDEDAPGAVFHVAARVNWRKYLLGPDHRKDRLVETLRAACESYGVEILGYVVMANHFHALLRSPARRLFGTLTSRRTSNRHRRPWPRGHQNASVLAQCMRCFMHSVSHVVQEEMGITGRLWEESYFARRIRDAEDLRTVLTYIHLNPVKGGLAERPEDHAWSSAPHWLDAQGRIWEGHGYRELPFGLDRATLVRRLEDKETERQILQAMRALQADGIDPLAPGTYDELVARIREIRQTSAPPAAPRVAPDDAAKL